MDSSSTQEVPCRVCGSWLPNDEAVWSEHLVAEHGVKPGSSVTVAFYANFNKRRERKAPDGD